MKRKLDVIFVPLGDLAVDLLSLQVLLAAPERVERVVLASAASMLDKRLADELVGARVRWECLTGATAAEAVNRALLITSGDVLLVADGFVPLKSTVAALEEVLLAEDRAGVVAPMADDSGTTEKDLDAFVASTGLPPPNVIPVPDMPVALIKRTTLAMAGAFDEKLGLPEALADFCLRAQRLGFVTMRAPRAWVSRSRHSFPVDFPAAPELVERHPYFAMQRLLATSDVRAQFSKRALAAKRGEPHVALDLRYLPEGAINGTSVYAVELVRGLVANTPAKLSLCVATEGQRQSLAPLGVPMMVGTLPDRVDLVHRPAQVFKAEDLPLLLNAPAPYVLSYQDLIAYRAGSVFAGNGTDHLKYRMMSWVAVRAAQGLIAISNHNRSEVIREFGVPEEHVRTVYHGVDATAFARREGSESIDAAALKPLGLPRRFFLFIGSDYAHKNVQLLLTAYATFRARWGYRDDVPGLVIVGHPSGTMQSMFPKLKQRPMVGVHYVGGVSHEALRAMYHRAVAFVYLSAYEGFGLPLLEAMAAETPILCSRFSSIPEVAGDATLFADDMHDDAVASQMVELAANEGLRAQLAAKGLARVKQFTWKRTATQTFEAYEAVLRNPSPKSFTEREWLRALVTRPLLVP